MLNDRASFTPFLPDILALMKGFVLSLYTAVIKLFNPELIKPLYVLLCFEDLSYA